MKISTEVTTAKTKVIKVTWEDILLYLKDKGVVTSEELAKSKNVRFEVEARNYMDLKEGDRTSISGPADEGFDGVIVEIENYQKRTAE